jgi:hypothetical protein
MFVLKNVAYCASARFVGGALSHGRPGGATRERTLERRLQRHSGFLQGSEPVPAWTLSNFCNEWLNVYCFAEREHAEKIMLGSAANRLPQDIEERAPVVKILRLSPAVMPILCGVSVLIQRYQVSDSFH